MYINVPIYGTFFIVMKGVFIMAVNEQIVTGRKLRKLIDEANKLWQRISFWTKASDVEFNDGKNAETKFGAINGVTDSLTSTASNIAASAKAVKTLNDKVTQLSSNIKSFVQTQLQAGSVLGTNCEQKYLNSGYSTLFASIIAYENDAAETFTINVSGSNDDVNYANIGMLSTTQNIVSIKNYKYIKLTCYNANGYGKKATWSIQVS